MSRVDYSKWDKLDVSSSEDEEDSAGFTSAGTTTSAGGEVQVTRLNQESTITFGGGSRDNNTVKVQPSSSAQLSENKVHKQHSNNDRNKHKLPTPATPSLPASQTNDNHGDSTNNATTTSNKEEILEASLSPPESWTEKGGVCHLSGNRDNRNDSVMLLWSQDRYSVTMRFAIPKGIIPVKPKKKPQWICQLQGNVVPYKERHSAVSTERAKLRIECKTENDNIVLVDDHLPYAVHWEEDHNGGGAINTLDGDDSGVGGAKQEEGAVLEDWSIERLKDSHPPYFTLTLQKATPMPGLVLWWKRPLQQCDEQVIDLKEQGGTAAQFQQAWNEAHKQFQSNMEKRKNTKKEG